MAHVPDDKLLVPQLNGNCTTAFHGHLGVIGQGDVLAVDTLVVHERLKMAKSDEWRHCLELQQLVIVELRRGR